MSGSERRIADVTGRFAQVLRDGTKLTDATWTGGRILLSNRRILLVSPEGKRSIPLACVSALGGRYDVNQTIAGVPRYVSVCSDEGVTLIETEDAESFEREVYAALLDNEIALTRHPAVVGGVVQDATWERARVKFGDGRLNVATAGGTFFDVDLQDVSSATAETRTVLDESKRTIEVEHTDDEASVQTHFSGGDRLCTVLESLFAVAMQENELEVTLEEKDEEILMALYSGVSPFEIPSLLDRDVDDVEATFERLIELDVLNEVRIRREVSLTPRGRNLATGTIESR